MSPGWMESGTDLLDRLVDEDRIASGRRGCGGEDKEPTRGNHSGPEGVVAGIDEMDAQGTQPLNGECGKVHRFWHGCSEAFRAAA